MRAGLNVCYLGIISYQLLQTIDLYFYLQYCFLGADGCERTYASRLLHVFGNKLAKEEGSGLDHTEPGDAIDADSDHYEALAPRSIIKGIIWIIGGKGKLSNRAVLCVEEVLGIFDCGDLAMGGFVSGLCFHYCMLPD